MNPLAICRPIPLFANAGVPMIFVTLPAMIFALVPIVIVEWLFLRRRVPNGRPWPMLRATIAANVVSTIIGVPLTWGALVVCELGVGFAASFVPAFDKLSWNSPIAQIVMTILSAPWIAPSEDMGLWPVPLASLALLVPFFFVSVLSERFVMEQMLPVTASDSPDDGEISEANLRRAVRDANLLTYAGLFALTCIWLISSLLQK